MKQITIEQIEKAIKEWHLKNNMTEVDVGVSWFEIKMTGQYEEKRLEVENFVDDRQSKTFNASSWQDVFFDALEFYNK